MHEETHDESATYRKMYFHMAHETEKAVRILIAAQQECENILLEIKEPLHYENASAIIDRLNDAT